MAIGTHTDGTFSPGATSTSWTALVNTATDDRIIQVVFDAAALAAGDVVEVRITEKALSGGTARVAWIATAANALSEPLIVSPSMIVLHGWSVEARQTTGTVRSFPWSVRAVS